MMKTLRTLATLFFLLLGAAQVRAADSSVVLYIFVEDGQAFTAEGRQLMLDFLKQSLPGKRVALVKTSSSRFFPNESKVHAQLLKQMSTVLLPGETISHLIIATHGGTTGEGTESQTGLQSVGKFTSEGFDSQLAKLLAPIKGRLESDAHVILDSCSTMCGTQDEAGARAAAFMKEIGAPEGVLYGATNNEVDVRKLGSQARTWEKLKPRLNLLRNVVLTSFALGVPIAWMGFGASSFSDNPFVAHAQVMGYTTALGLVMFQYMEPLMIFFYEKMKSINEGRIFVFAKGKMQRVVEISKRIESLGRIYHARACTRVFEN